MKKNRLIFLRLTILGIAVGFSAVAMSQQTTGNIDKQADIQYGTTTTGGTIRVVDNKGTMKYLQVQNGMTMLTNTTSNKTTTTWQLGGALVNNTYIDASGKVFALDGLPLVTDASNAAAGNDATDKSVHTGTDAGKWTVLIRDEATGALMKIRLGDLLSVEAGYETKTVAASGSAAVGAVKEGDASATITLSGWPGSVATAPSISKVTVYRNGVKLMPGTTSDYAAPVASTDGSTHLTTVTTTITPSSNWAFYEGDVIELYWVK